MSSTAPRPKMTAHEYLAWEREQLGKHEFHDGEIFAMAGGAPGTTPSRWLWAPSFARCFGGVTVAP